MDNELRPDHAPPSVFLFLSPWNLGPQAVALAPSAEDAMRDALHHWCFSLCTLVIPEQPRARRGRVARVLAGCMLGWYRDRCATRLIDLAVGLAVPPRPTSNCENAPEGSP